MQSMELHSLPLFFYAFLAVADSTLLRSMVVFICRGHCGATLYAVFPLSFEFLKCDRKALALYI